MEIKVPSRVKISGHEYTVVFRKNLHVDEDYTGLCLRRKQRLEIEPMQAESEKCVTLYHEIMHMINHIYGCDLEEKNIDRIAQGLTDFQRNNLHIEWNWNDIPIEE